MRAGRLGALGISAVQEQSGLKLIPGKEPVETLVVDAAQKPEANSVFED